jgi:hypothetical protein
VSVVRPAAGKDGADFDGDGQCDASDPDDGNDGVADEDDMDPFNTRLCEDVDGNECEDFRWDNCPTTIPAATGPTTTATACATRSAKILTWTVCSVECQLSDRGQHGADGYGF